MAKEKRMFNSAITKHDDFLDMPLSAQALYFHLNLEADDEGFVSNVKSLMRQVRSTEDDLKILIAKRYILRFESGVVVVKHWLIHNTIRQDRIIETKFIEEKQLLDIKENGSYTEKKGVRHLTDICPPNNTNLILSNTELKEDLKDVKTVIDYLNEKLGTKYRYNNTRTQASVTSRLKEGFTVDDFIKVIDVKTEEWQGTEMAKYLNPETLFRPSNFEKYVNQSKITKKEEVSHAKTNRI